MLGCSPVKQLGGRKTSATWLARTLVIVSQRLWISRSCSIQQRCKRESCGEFAIPQWAKLKVLVKLFMPCEYGRNVEDQQEAHFWAEGPAHSSVR